jgi:hypothetical protein
LEIVVTNPAEHDTVVGKVTAAVIKANIGSVERYVIWNHPLT